MLDAIFQFTIELAVPYSIVKYPSHLFMFLFCSKHTERNSEMLLTQKQSRFALKKICWHFWKFQFEKMSSLPPEWWDFKVFLGWQSVKK